MLFSLLLARLLAPGTFAQLATFLALYLVLSMPGFAISAAAALAPGRSARARPLLWRGGVVAGVALIAASPWVGPALRLPVPMVVVLGLSGPAVGTLALDRGRLYGWNRRAQLVASLSMEPAVRLTLGLVLVVAVGAVGGALAVTVGGYAALEIAWRHVFSVGRPPSTAPDPGPELTTPQASDAPTTVVSAAKWTAGAFLALVVIQNQDLLFANRLLSPAQAGQFAVLSILGGLAAFATMTIPLVLLPRSGSGVGGGLFPALSLTALIGGAAVAFVAVMPAELLGAPLRVPIPCRQRGARPLHGRHGAPRHLTGAGGTPVRHRRAALLGCPGRLLRSPCRPRSILDLRPRRAGRSHSPP